MRTLLMTLVVVALACLIGFGLLIWYVRGDVSVRRQAVENISRTPGKLIMRAEKNIQELEIGGCEYRVHWVDGDAGLFYHKLDCHNPVHKR